MTREALVEDPRFSTISGAVAAVARGEIVIVVDDPGRENEGDFVMAADLVTADAVNFMVTHGRGLVCLPMASERIDALGLRAMVPGPADGGSTAFTVSIDLLEPPNTGISAHDRAQCVRRAIEPDARLNEFRLGGHIFPLRARAGGVLARPGHTEAAVDLARMAGRAPAGVICEILRSDGGMARVPDLLRMAEQLGMPIVTIADLRAYRLQTETLVERGGTASLPTPYGTFRARAYTSTVDGVEHVALVYGDPRAHPAPLVRLHSECLTGDALSSVRCDCGAQLREAQRLIAAEGAGAIVYIRGHEGRGIGLVQKMRAYTLQDRGLDTVEANLALGLPADARTYCVGAHILRDLGLGAVRLLTNNLAKRAGLEEAGMTVLDRIPLQTTPTVHNLPYLEAKRDKLGHDLALA